MKMNFGIIGYGKMGKIYHDVILSMGGTVGFICDVIKQEKDIEFYSEYKEAIDKSVVDGIVISTYGPSHYDIMSYAIEKELKYIVCEKPFTTSVKQADEIINKISKSKTRLTVNYSRRFSTAYLDLKAKLNKKNMIGKPCSVIITCGAGGPSTIGTHFFDLCSFLLGSRVKSVYSVRVDKKLPNPRGGGFEDPGGYILLNFENEGRAYLDLGDDLGLQPLIEIVGEYGRAIIDELNNNITIRGRSKEDRNKPKNLYGLPNPIITSEPFRIGTMNELILKLMKNLLSKSDLIVNAELAKDKVEIYSAIRQSFDTKQTTHLPLKTEYYEKEFMVT